MNNPYEVLEVRENATDEEIKNAYRDLVKKYHPDKYQNNPLADLAEEKLREVNEAYDEIMRTRRGGGSTYGGAGTYSGANRQSPEYRQIRMDLDAGKLDEAGAQLNAISDRNAEWTFLMGILYYKRGWYDNAVSTIQMAVNMDPQNMEYRQALNSIMGMSSGYTNTAMGRGYQSQEDLACKLCTCYICTDACCDCI